MHLQEILRSKNVIFSFKIRTLISRVNLKTSNWTDVNIINDVIVRVRLRFKENRVGVCLGNICFLLVFNEDHIYVMVS